MKSILLLVLFVGLVSARFHHHFDRRQETPDLGQDCEEFTPPFAELIDEAAIEAHCGGDDDCLKRAERCKFRLECKTFGEMTHDEIVNICGAGEDRDEWCWMKVENCDRFANLEDRVRNLEESVKQSTAEQCLFDDDCPEGFVCKFDLFEQQPFGSCKIE